MKHRKPVWRVTIFTISREVSGHSDPPRVALDAGAHFDPTQCVSAVVAVAQ